MASKKKLRKANEEEESNDSDSSESDDGNGEAYSGNEVIQVDFEGRNPMASDFHGIRQLMQQLFLKSDINLSELADVISDQNFIGSVVIQSFLDDDDDDEDSDDEGDTQFESSGTIFGVTTAVNISKIYATGCIDDVRKYLLSKCDQYANASHKELFKSALNDENKQTALIVNERFINIPAQISVPLLENLQKEIARAATKKDKFKFTHYIMIIKFNRKEAKKNTASSEDFYSNGEEEILDEHADASFEFSVARETDSALSGNWTERDSTLVPHRKVVIFEEKKLPIIIDSIKALITE